MKRIDIFCASQASTAICLSMDQASCSSSNTILLGGRTIDRHNPIINDSRRSTSKSLTAPCSSSQSPINPKPYHELHKAKKNSSSKNATKGHDNQKKRSTAEKLTEHVTNTSKPIDDIVPRKPYHELHKAKKNSSSKNAAKGHDNHHQKKSTAEKLTEHVTNTSKPVDGIVRRGWLKPPANLITPPGSTRSLLSDTALLDGSSDFDPVLALTTTVNNKTSQVGHQDEANPVSKLSSSSHPKSGSSDQVSFLSLP